MTRDGPDTIVEQLVRQAAFALENSVLLLLKLRHPA